MASARSNRLHAALLLFLGACGNVVVEGQPGSSDETRPGSRCDQRPAPAPFKSCTKNSDCTIVFTVLECCGAVGAVGINGSYGTAFAVFDEECSPEATCDCDPGPAQTDDGSTTHDAEAIHVSCDEGRCLTVVE